MQTFWVAWPLWHLAPEHPSGNEHNGRELLPLGRFMGEMVGVWVQLMGKRRDGRKLAFLVLKMMILSVCLRRHFYFGDCIGDFSG